MRRFLLVALALVMAAGTAYAQCADCTTKIFGYMAPNFRMIDSGSDDAKNNMGFGMAYNRVVWAGKVEGGKIVKNVAWRVETDLLQTGNHILQYAYVEPMFNEMFSVRFGRDKKPFGLEALYSTPNQITIDRHPGTGGMTTLGYANFGYGLSANIKHEVFNLKVGAYDGQGARSSVNAQDPALDFGARIGITPPAVPNLEIGANIMMTTLPEAGKDQGIGYVDTDDDEYLTNSGMAFGVDVNFAKELGTMALQLQGEFDMGDNWMDGPEDPEEEDTWEDYSWYKFQYFYLKGRLNVTPDLGIYLGFSMWDPNTDSDAGENDELTTITPGLIYYWTKNLRTMVEIQMITQGMGVDEEGEELEDGEYTHFVLQQVFIWP